MSNTEQCSNCRFYLHQGQNERDGAWGWCRRFPPNIPTPDSPQYLATHPDVRVIDWCGEHEPIEEERPDETLEGISEEDARRIGEAFGDAL